MIYLTILNTVIIIYILFNKDFSVDKETIFRGTIVGFNFFYKRKRYLYIPIRNREKTEVRENILYMIHNPQGKRQKLRAMFSWLKTVEEVEKFKKNYEVVDRRLVNDLVNNFKLKNQGI